MTVADDFVPEFWRDKPEGWRKHIAECDDCNVRYGDKSLAKVTVRRADLAAVLDVDMVQYAAFEAYSALMNALEA